MNSLLSDWPETLHWLKLNIHFLNFCVMRRRKNVILDDNRLLACHNSLGVNYVMRNFSGYSSNSVPKSWNMSVDTTWSNTIGNYWWNFGCWDATTPDFEQSSEEICFRIFKLGQFDYSQFSAKNNLGYSPLDITLCDLHSEEAYNRLNVLGNFRQAFKGSRYQWYCKRPLFDVRFCTYWELNVCYDLTHVEECE